MLFRWGNITFVAALLATALQLCTEYTRLTAAGVFPGSLKGNGTAELTSVWPTSRVVFYWSVLVGAGLSERAKLICTSAAQRQLPAVGVSHSVCNSEQVRQG